VSRGRTQGGRLKKTHQKVGEALKVMRKKKNGWEEGKAFPKAGVREGKEEARRGSMRKRKKKRVMAADDHARKGKKEKQKMGEGADSRRFGRCGLTKGGKSGKESHPKKKKEKFDE